MRDAVRYSTRNRQTGTTIILLDRNDPEPAEAFPQAPGRWVIICQEHSRFSAYVKQGDAYKAMTNPTWCLECRGMIANGEKVTTPAKPGSFADFKEARAGSSTEQSTGAPSFEAPAPTLQDSGPEDVSSNLTQSTRTIVRMSPGERERSNVCFQCSGNLKSTSLQPIGHFHEAPSLPSRAICCQCAGHVADAQEA